MPIYAYRCSACGHAKDLLQKLSDPVLTECPACGAPTFTKQVTAAGFQLKGSGWYVTDFRGDGKPPKAGDDATKSADAKSEPAKTDTASAPAAAAKTDSAASAPAPAASAPAAAPASAAPSAGSK
jgi:putative FmdB family regulatory protein